MKDNWGKAFTEVIKSEGGFTDDTRDPGNRLPDGRVGSTMLGVTQRNWERYVGRQVTHDEMKALTPTIVQPFYKIQYWDAVKGDQLPRGIDYLCYDLAVTSGPVRAGVVLQQALGVNADGIIGRQTLNAAALADKAQLAQKFTDQKIAFYKSLNNPVYEKGWINRANEALTIAQRMMAAG